ncbi:MAG: phosphate signaling complex protein PhoU [Proteobacteria bacterium]|nr:phosphate signaling complex protein PhoU [Pseudomonadota bacterium]
MLEEKIISLRREIIEYATRTEGMIEQSIQGLLNKDRVLLIEIIEHDEPQANEYEIIIEELCIALIARYEPKAKDLRTILMFLKINNDLERAADHAVNISESAIFLIGQPTVKPLIDIPKMALESISMLKDSINSFIKEDIVLARNVCERDSIVDELGNQTMRELITFMTVNAGTIERSLHLLKIARNLERIADLSTNISEDVIFMVEGETIKHHMLGKDVLS